MNIVKNKGFTLIELIIVLSLLSVVGVATGTYISDAFRDSNRLADKTEVQNSVTALMNKIETTIKEANVPVFNGEITNGDSAVFEVNGKDGEVRFELNSSKMTANTGETYENIASVTVTDKGKTGAFIEIVGKDTGYKLTGEYYTQNMEEEIVKYTVNHQFNNESQITSVSRTGITGQMIDPEEEVTNMGEFQYNSGYDIDISGTTLDDNGKFELKKGENVVIDIKYSRKPIKIELVLEDGWVLDEITEYYGKKYSKLPFGQLEDSDYIIDKWNTKANKNGLNITNGQIVTDEYTKLYAIYK